MYAPMMNNVNLFKESHISYDICMYLHIIYIYIHTYINTLGYIRPYMISYDLHDMSTSCAISSLIIEAPLANHQICPRVLAFGERPGGFRGDVRLQMAFEIWENMGK